MLSKNSYYSAVGHFLVGILHFVPDHGHVRFGLFPNSLRDDVQKLNKKSQREESTSTFLKIETKYALVFFLGFQNLVRPVLPLQDEFAALACPNVVLTFIINSEPRKLHVLF